MTAKTFVRLKLSTPKTVPNASVKNPISQLVTGTANTPLELARIVTLATLVQDRATLTAQFATNHTADHHAASSAVSPTVNFGNF
jgi:hypothetical protein